MDRLQVNDALEHAHTTIEAVSAHLSERHSTKLELIIIWLIVVEVVLAGDLPGGGEVLIQRGGAGFDGVLGAARVLARSVLSLAPLLLLDILPKLLLVTTILTWPLA